MMISSLFVYGTLKRGECRSELWPRDPLSIVPAWVRGTLYGRFDYPALKTGVDRVLGERWQFVEDDMDTVLKTLDEIEGTNQPGQPNLYDRVNVTAFDLDGKPLGISWGYYYSREPFLDGFAEIPSKSSEAFVQWPVTHP